MANKTVVDSDPFLHDPNANDPEKSFNVPLVNDNPPGLTPSLGDVYPNVPISSQPPIPSQQVEDEPESEVTDIDGGTVTITHDNKGWHGELQLEDGGGTEVFHGKTQKELMVRCLQGKAKATAQIRKLNKKLKLGGRPESEPATVPQQNVFQPNSLSANDVFEIKTAADADLDKAMSLRFQKKYGMSEEDFVSLVHQTRNKAEKGEEAYEELNVESICKEFLERHSEDYYAYPENGDSLIKWVCIHKLKRNPKTTDNFGTISAEALKRGLFTVDVLEEAFEDLSDSGLLTPPPNVEPEEPAPQPVTRRQEQPANPEPRIANVRRQPRAAYGVRPSSISTRQPEPETAPSVEDFDNMSTEELRKTLNAAYSYARKGR